MHFTYQHVINFKMNYRIYRSHWQFLLLSTLFCIIHICSFPFFDYKAGNGMALWINYIWINKTVNQMWSA